jgi:hypothetical protein
MPDNRFGTLISGVNIWFCSSFQHTWLAVENSLCNEKMKAELQVCRNMAALTGDMLHLFGASGTVLSL